MLMLVHYQTVLGSRGHPIPAQHCSVARANDPEIPRSMLRTGTGRNGLSQRTTCLYELIEAQVERTPDAVAVVFEGEQSDLPSTQWTVPIA